MEEICNYLKDFYDEIILQEICENNRSSIQYSHGNGRKLSWTETLTKSLNHIQYSGAYLKKGIDPSHWTTSNGSPIQSMNHVLIPHGYSVCIDWKIHIDNQLTTDTEGWQYNHDFTIQGWTIIPSSDSHVRHRKWERLLVRSDVLSQAKVKVQQFSTQKREFRSFCPQLIISSLKNIDYQFQFILECQRLLTTSRPATVSEESAHFYQEVNLRNEPYTELLNYSELHLLSTDPSQWSIVSPNIYPYASIASINPCTVPPTNLTDAYPFLYANPNGRNSLHEFIFTYYPNKDSQGWEYNIDFHSNTPWSSSHHPRCCVRRRLWFRTLVPINLLPKCRQLLSNYINLHPRGLCFQGILQRISFYRKRWTQGIARLSNSTFSLELQNNYQKNYNFSLLNIEVKPLDSIHDLEKYLSSSSSSSPASSNFKLSDWHEITGSSSTSTNTSTRTSSTNGSNYNTRSMDSNLSNITRTNLFCLCSLNSSGQYTGIQVILNALSPLDRIQWITLLSHQIALYNLSFWSLYYSPPIVDTIVYQGELMKLGHIVRNWKLRRFELTQRGILSYYHGKDLRGRIRLRGCQIDWNNGINGIRNEIKITKLNGYQLILRGETANDILPWMNELKSFTGLELEDEKHLNLHTSATRTTSTNIQKDHLGYVPSNLAYDESSLPLPPHLDLFYDVSRASGIVVTIPTENSQVRYSSTYAYPEEEKVHEKSLLEHQPRQSTTNAFIEEDRVVYDYTSIGTSNLADNPQVRYSSTYSYPEEEKVQANSLLECQPRESTTNAFLEEDRVVNDDTSVSTSNPAPASSSSGLKSSSSESNIQPFLSMDTLPPTMADSPPISTQTLIDSDPPTDINHVLSSNATISTEIIDNATEKDFEAHTEVPTQIDIQTEHAMTDVDLLVGTEPQNIEENVDNSFSIMTHELSRNHQGRRVSILQSAVVETATEKAIWGGNDSDESEDETSRSSSFSESYLGGDRPLSLRSPKQHMVPPSSVQTHELSTNQHGRRVSTLNATVVEKATESAVWGGNDSDESDGDSLSRTSSFDSSLESRPLSLRPVSQSHDKNEIPPSSSPAESPSNVEEPSPNPTPRTFSSMFGFGYNRRKSL